MSSASSDGGRGEITHVLIGELSERTGVSTRMLRYYEQEGLLVPRRADNGYRVYEEEDVELVAGLRCLHDLGLDLRTSAELARLGCGLGSPPGSEDRGAVLRAVDAQLDAITSRRRELDAMAETLDDLRGQLTSQGA
jgi:DNA-binding transcriptional MerR regulator